MSSHDPEIISAILERTTPFVDDPTYAAQFYDAIGKVLLLWGRIEKSLDDLLISGIVIAQDDDERHRIYVTLSRKLQLLVQIFYSSPDLRPFHSRAVSVSNDVRENSNKRNQIIHASWVGFESGVLKMQNLRHEPGHITVNDFTVIIQYLSQMGSNFHLCNAKILALQIDTLEILKKARERAGTPKDRVPPAE